jgi:hypothetical protein
MKMREENDTNSTLNPYILRPDEVRAGDQMGYKIIAVVDESGYFWAAYMGLTDWSDERVANEGDKLPVETAMKIFPVLLNCTEKRYNP